MGLASSRSGGRFSGTAAGQAALNRIAPCVGVVVSGLDVVVNSSREKAYKSGRRIDPPVIERIRIFSVGEVAPLPEPEPYTDQRSHPSLRQDEKKPGATPEVKQRSSEPDES